ncbi:MAG TPA: glycosyltransferase family 2 protein [Armatimonadota bacterium]|nr:glycosyltransferase family 2 protein [Armatimonadota bacterium]
MSHPSVSAVVVWGQEDLHAVQTTIDSLRAGTAPCHEIIVVETARNEREVMHLRGLYREPVLLSLARGEGRAYALASGARAATAQQLLFVEAGTTLDTEALARLREHLDDHPEAAAAQPLVVIAESENFVYAAASCLTRGGWVVPCSYGERTSKVAGRKSGAALPNESCVLVRREKLDRVGGLDTELFDAFCMADLGIRLLAAGGEIGFVPEAWARQPYGYPERTYIVRRARLRLAAKTMPLGRLVLMSGKELLRDAYLGLRAVCHRSRAEAAQLMRKWLWLLWRFPSAARLRRELVPWYRRAASAVDGGAPERAPRLSAWPPPCPGELTTRRMAAVIHLARPPEAQVGLGWEPPGAYGAAEGLVARSGATVFLPWPYPLITPLSRITIYGESTAPGRLEVEINGCVTARLDLSAGAVSACAPLGGASSLQRVSLYPLPAADNAPPPTLRVHTIAIGWEGCEADARGQADPIPA